MRRTLIVIGVFFISASTVWSMTLTGDIRWHGEKIFTETVRVEKDARLVVEKGARVIFKAGGLEVSGRLEARDALFTGSGWDGIVLKGCDETTTLLRTTIEGARTGIVIRGGSPRLVELVLERNDVGIELRQKTSATVSESIFRGNGKVGLFVKDEAAPVVTGNRFEENGRFGCYVHRANPAKFSGNVFMNNPTGLAVSYSGSDPRIEGNRFEGNEMGVLADRAARPSLVGNIIRKNGTGIRLYRRSDGRVEKNLFDGNETAISLSFSSYPRIIDNDFSDNGKALLLEFQSSDWDEAKGEGARKEETTRRGSFGQTSTRDDVLVARPTLPLDGTVDARNNWWGEGGTDELRRIGEGGNPSFIHDGRDAPTFEEGGAIWPLDTVRFAPWSTKPLTTLSVE